MKTLRMTSTVLALVIGWLLVAVAPVRAQTEVMSPKDLFAALSPSVPLIETPIGSGSGFVIDDRHVVTAAHVVKPYQKADIEFTDGTRHDGVPVVAWDLIADVAVLEFPTALPYAPLPVTSDSSVAVGDTVYVIGYRQVNQQNRTPSLTSGLIARTRRWETVGLNYLESDAQGAPGDSGGPMVSEAGLVVGVTQFITQQGGFTLAVSASLAVDRAKRAVAGVDVDGLGNRPVTGMPVTEQQLVLEHLADSRQYLLWVDDPVIAQFELTGTGDGALLLQPFAGGYSVSADDNESGRESLAFPIGPEDSPYVLTVTNWEIGRSSYLLHSNVSLAPVEDSDDGRTVTSGRFNGNLDQPNDVDWYRFDLAEGQSVSLTVETPHFDSEAFVRSVDIAVGFFERDSDSGGGIWNVDAQIEFVAPSAGTYEITLFGGDGTELGAYVLVVSIGRDPNAPPPAFSGPLPSAGIALALWNGGDIETLIAVASQDGCTLASFWVTGGGTLTGYVAGAPGFVNAAILDRFPDGEIPTGTPMILLCGAE